MTRENTIVGRCTLRIALVFGMLTISAVTAVGQSRIRVVIDPRVELVGVVYRLGGHPEFAQGKVLSYLNDVDSYFAPYRDHPAVRLSQELRATRGISFDAVMQLALHVDDAFAPAPMRPLNDESLMLYGDGRWTPADAERFIEQLADFVKTSRFDDFYSAHAAIYDHTRQAMQSFVDAHVDLGWLHDFFGVTPTESFTVIPSMINGPANYGPKFRDADGREHFYAIVGVNTADDQGLPRIDSESLELVIHEFSHSFVNHLVEAQRALFEDAGSSMYAKLESAMNRMGYNNWKTMVDESLVRVAVIRYLQAHEGADVVTEQVRKEVNRSFLWMPDLSQLAGTYEDSRGRYATFKSFIPRVASFFAEYAQRLDGAIAMRERELERQRPHVVSIQPSNGSTDVDAAATHLIITFDRAMSSGYAVAGAGDGEPGMQPQVTNFRWNEDRTMLEADMRLEPGASYAFSLNTEGYAGFKSAEGVPLKPYVVRFSTRPRREPAETER